MNYQKIPAYFAYAVMAFGIAYAGYAQFGDGQASTAAWAIGILIAVIAVIWIMFYVLSAINVEKIAPNKPR